MNLLLALLLAASPYVRTPDKSPLPDYADGPVWVQFTDKGVFDDASCAAAIAAHRPTAADAALARRLSAANSDCSFDDLPLRDSYIRAIERLGGRLRRRSNWLNAASFDLPKQARDAVYRLPFVYGVRPVATGSAREPVPFSLGRTPTQDHRKTDTADARRFYGPSYDQAQMMGVPDVFFRGHFGAGVRLGIFDTGLRLANQAVARMRIWKQHDFLSGDNAVACRSTTDWTPVPVANLTGFGLVHSPVLAVQAQPSGGDTLPAILAFAADSFAYGYGLPRRAIFAAVTRDRGASWSAAQPVVRTERPWDVTFEDLVTNSAGNAIYLAYTEVTANTSGPATATVNLGYFQNALWQPLPGYVSLGRVPALASQRETLYLAYVKQDSLVTVRRYGIAGIQPSWLIPEAVVNVHEPVTDAGVVVGPGTADVYVVGRRSGLMRKLHSVDGGQTFDTGSVVVAAGARAMKVAAAGTSLALCYKDDSETPFTRLALLRSSDAGLTWTAGSPVIDSTLSLGDYLVLLDSTRVSVFYEVAGLVHRAISTDFGATWATAGPLDTTGFCYLPAATQVGNTQLLTWFKRGDDSTTWQESDNAKFAWEQPHHGTRMASIIAGYQQYGIVGIAPGVDLLIAKTELYKTRSGQFYEYSMEEDIFIEALEWAEACGADIISASLGYHGWYGDEQLDGQTAPISVACEMAARRGLVIVAAMGNRDTTLYRWPEPYITAPGDAEHVITAGGVEKNGVMWRGTGSGPTADGRIKPDLVALSDTVTVVAPDSAAYLDGSVGTSCATALIAGACALVKEIHPEWSADSIRAALFATATRSVKSCTLGFGVPRVDSLYRLFPPGPEHPDVSGDRISLVYPNPFVTSQHDRVYFAIELTQPAPLTVGADSMSPARIAIYSTSGSLVCELPLSTATMGRPGRYGFDGDVAALDAIGAYWDGRNSDRKPVASGIYTAVLRTTFSRSVTKLALVR